MFAYIPWPTNIMFSQRILRPPPFSKLVEAARCTKESVKRTPQLSLANRSNPTVRPFHRKRLIVAAIERSRESKPSRPERPSFKQEYKLKCRQEKKAFAFLPSFLYCIRKGTALIEQLVKDFVIFFPHIDCCPQRRSNGTPIISRIIARKDIPQNNVSLSGESFTISSK